MEINNWYNSNFENRLQGRYITLENLLPIMKGYKNSFEISVVGSSEKGREIHLIKIGKGPKTIFAWSQMHGNESTTTKALFDLIKFFNQRDSFQEEIEGFLKCNTLYILPMLNPDGAMLYTRENANGIDLNRDAQNISQSESRCLRDTFDRLDPDLCLNMHDQRSIYGFDNGCPATVSFLSPASDEDCSITESRKVGMAHIVRMEKYLQKIIPGQVGRYDDSFNPNCVGDTFQMLGVPTILFEAGHYKNDYHREKSREFIFYSLLSLFGILGDFTKSTYEDYFKIPENRKNYRDFILRNAKIGSSKTLKDIGIQYDEILVEGKIHFKPSIDGIGFLDNFFGHKEANAKGSVVLTNFEENLTNYVKVSENADLEHIIRTYFHPNVFFSEETP